MKDILEIVNAVTDVVLKYKPQRKQKSKRKQKKRKFKRNS
jgi:hypothetical protein